MPEFTGRLRTPRLPSAPSSPVVGELYYNTATNILYCWNGTAWVSSSGGGSSDNLRYNGDWAAGSYLEGDIVIDGGVSYMAVKPTSARPAAWPVTSPIPDRLAAIAVAVPGNDANNAVSNGWYLLAPTTANRGPINQYAVLRADVIDATNVFQTVYTYGDDRVYTRRSTAGSWSAWTQVGAGAGVDYIGNWGAGTAYKKGDVVRYSNQDYMAVNDSTGVTPTPAMPVGITPINYATTLPTSPFDGQETVSS